MASNVPDRLAELRDFAQRKEPDHDTRDLTLQLIAAIEALRAEMSDAARCLKSRCCTPDVVAARLRNADQIITDAAPMLGD